MTGDFNRALEASKAIRDQYPREEVEDTPALVLEYYQALIDFCEQGGITRKQACFLIADTMHYNCVRQDWTIESIAIDAGYQELPDRQITGDPDERWKLLKIWVLEKILDYR